jgi:hypothetical protein
MFPSLKQSFLTCCCLWMLIGIVSYQSASANESSLSIRKILSVRCSGCHNPSDKQGGLDLTTFSSAREGGDSGPALVLGDRTTSLFWTRIQSHEMPPKERLTPDEQEAVRVWIDSDKPWPLEPIDPLEFTSSTRAGYDWWSLQPLQAIDPPVRTTSNPIDAFIDLKLAEHHLVHSPPADRTALARRMAIDLTGLPPSQDSMQSFVKNNTPEATLQWLDDLLDEPAYGQRWARHWLDTVRFGESHGFERDQLRTNAWRYRDWVVDALNRDMPYDAFCRYQIAGDALVESGSDGRIATGMMVAGPYDQVGQTQQSAAMRSVVRQDELEDYVSLVGQTFLGLTINCSRCHDHKFDPIPQREYYQLCAALAGTHHGERSIDLEQLGGKNEAIAARIDQRKLRIVQEIASIENPVRQRLLASKPDFDSYEVPKPIARWEFDSPQDSIGDMHLELKHNAKIQDGKLWLQGNAYAQSLPMQQSLSEKTLEVLVRLPDLNQRGGAAISIEALDGLRFDAIVFGELEPTQWMAGSEGFARSDSFQAKEHESSNDLLHLIFAYDTDGTIRSYRNGVVYGSPIHKSGLVNYAADHAHVLFGLRHSPIAPDRMLHGEIERAALYDKALTEQDVAMLTGVPSNHLNDSEIEQSLQPNIRKQLTALRFELRQLQDQSGRLSDSNVYCTDSKAPSETFVLVRGNPGLPGTVVLPGGVAAIRGVETDFKLESNATDSQRRLALANWMTNRSNPLFARVIVNRVWQYHFGVGIVETPNDFGFNGGRPSHPELLDWLANDLLEHGWSLKHLHRRIMSSRCYQQASRITPTNLAKDASNRWLWRMSPKRLDAETLRDTMLTLTGELDRSLDGPGAYDFSLYVNNSHFYTMQDPIGESFQRRTLYRTWVRSARSNLLDVFDCPDPSTKTPLRASTTTPLQSLSLLNNAFVLRIADSWAKKARLHCDASIDSQVNYLFHDAFYRDASVNELEACVAMANQSGLESVCRVLLNSNELLHVD